MKKEKDYVMIDAQALALTFAEAQLNAETKLREEAQTRVGTKLAKLADGKAIDDKEAAEFKEDIARLSAGPRASRTRRTEAGKLATGSPSTFKQAVPTLIATFGAALVAAAAEKGSPLRFAGAVPGVIDAVNKAREKRDFNEIALPLASAAAGAAAPALIK